VKLQIFSTLHCDVVPIKPITIGEDVEAVVVAVTPASSPAGHDTDFRNSAHTQTRPAAS
jgi:hypothetical protein